MLGTGTARRPLGRTIVHVLDRHLARLRAARRRGRLLGHRRGARPRPLAERRGGHRRRPDGAARAHQGPDRQGPGRQQEGRERRVVPRLRGRQISQVVGYASTTYGRAGLERAYDAELTGLAGDPVTDAFAKFGADRYDPKDLTLSLSWDLQKAAVAALGKRRGAVVMLDPTTGEVLALASTPTYDASAIANPDTAKATFEGLQDDPSQPLLPRATLGRYVPGSVFKIVTAVAGLGSGAITPDTTYKQQPAGREDGLLVDGLPGPRRPPPRDRLDARST